MTRARTVAEGWVPSSHGPSAYNRGCRCGECRRAHALRISRSAAGGRHRAANYARRVMVGGRWFAPGREGRHGEVDTYNRYGCRCVPCATVASQYYGARRRDERPAIEAAR